MALLATLERTRQRLAQMAKAAQAQVRPHAHMQIKPSALTHTSQEAKTAMEHTLVRRFAAMRSTVVRLIHEGAAKKLLDAGALQKMDVTTVDEFKQATCGKTRYSVNHLFDKPMQLRPRGKRPYGNLKDIYEKDLRISQLTPTQYWVVPKIVLEYAEDPSSKPVHVVARNGLWLLSDGHHRACADRLNGEKIITAKIFPRWASDAEIKHSHSSKFAVGDLAKADNYDDLVDEILKALQDDFETIPADVESFLQTAALSGLTQGVIAIDVSDTGLLADANTTAKQWAADRAAEMVGMKYDDEGNLVDNPNPRWVITDSTRAGIQDAVEQAFAAPSTMADIAAAIDETGIFDPARAEMIARTEVQRAQMMGNLELWMQSGVVQEYDWLFSEDNPCDECQELAAGGPYVLGEGPLPIDDSHPNCECVIAAAKTAGEEE